MAQGSGRCERVPETSIFENIDFNERKRVLGWLGANYTHWCWLVMLLMCSGRVNVRFWWSLNGPRLRQVSARARNVYIREYRL
jgi:hypothetical protein